MLLAHLLSELVYSLPYCFSPGRGFIQVLFVFGRLVSRTRTSSYLTTDVTS